MRTLLLALLSVHTATVRAEAQLGSALMHPSSVWNVSVHVEARPSLTASAAGASQSYWREGLIIGGVLGGIAGGALAGGMCGDSDSGYSGGCVAPTIGGVLVGALIGAVPGVLIGGRFPKHPKATQPTSEV